MDRGPQIQTWKNCLFPSGTTQEPPGNPVIGEISYHLLERMILQGDSHKGPKNLENIVINRDVLKH